MRTNRPIKIIAMGKYLPAIQESAVLEQRLGIRAGWSERYSGVERRHHVTTETGAYMGARAAEEALQKANLNLGDIDLMISAGGTFDYPLPNQASVIKSQMKNSNQWDTPAIDIDSTCLSFVTALDMSSKLISSETKRILIITSEIASKGLDPANFETSTLFGDGAVACIVEYDENGDSHLINGMHKTFSKGVFYTLIEGGGNTKHFKDHPYDSQLHSFKMSGRPLLKMSKRKVPEFIKEFFKDLDTDMLDTDVIIPHQASKMGLALFKSIYKFKEGQLKESLSRYGNCIAASIPLTLADCIESGEIKRGDTCFMIGTSAGFSIGGILLKF